MRLRELELSQQLDRDLQEHSTGCCPLPGVSDPGVRSVFVEQLVESIRRVKYVAVIRHRQISPLRADANSELFDPIKAAILRQQSGQIEDAFWLVFLSVHFGRHRTAGWRLARDIYGALGGSPHWDWPHVSAHPQDFRNWLTANRATLEGADGVVRRFGNHRKYESLDPTSSRGTGAAVQTYVKWVLTHGTHQALVQDAEIRVGGDPALMFHHLYASMTAVASFGRTARFDFLTMVGKLDLAPIQPGSTYMDGATGPLRGARLLFGDATAKSSFLDAQVKQLAGKLNVGMQVMEDALCNWQKSPHAFKPFRG